MWPVDSGQSCWPCCKSLELKLDLKKADWANDRHIILTHISQLCWQRKEKGTNDYTHIHIHTHRDTWRLSQFISLDICPIITTDSGGFQLATCNWQQQLPLQHRFRYNNNIIIMPPVRYIWLCLVKQITTTNKLHRNQSVCKPTKGTATDTKTKRYQMYLYIH